MGKMKKVVIWSAGVVLVIANVAFCVARIVDAFSARAGNPPRFTLLPPMWIEPQTRLTELLVLGIMPGLSVGLPLLMWVWGIVAWLLRRKSGGGVLLPVAFLVGGLLLLGANLVTMYVIRHSMPVFQAM